MDTRSAVAGRDEDARAHDNQAPPYESQVPLLEQIAISDHVSVAPPLMSDGEITEDFLNLAQAMTSKDNVVTSQVQSMMAQVNQEVGPRMTQHARTMASYLRDFTRMNPPMFN